MEYSHAKDIGEDTGRLILLVGSERRTGQYRFAHSTEIVSRREKERERDKPESEPRRLRGSGSRVEKEIFEFGKKIRMYRDASLRL